MQTLWEWLESWARILDEKITAVEANDGAVEKESAHTGPRSHYSQDRVKSNMANARSEAKAVYINMSEAWESIPRGLTGVSVSEQKTIANIFEDIKTQIIERFGIFTSLQIEEHLQAMIGKLFIETARNIVI